MAIIEYTYYGSDPDTGEIFDATVTYTLDVEGCDAEGTLAELEEMYGPSWAGGTVYTREDLLEALKEKAKEADDYFEYLDKYSHFGDSWLYEVLFQGRGCR